MIDAITAALKEKLPDAKVTVENGALVVDRASLIEVSTFLRDDQKLDFLSNLCATDWLKEGYLEVVYHLYSIGLRTGPLTMKCRTGNRGDDVHMPSVTPIWRSAEYQEREAYDLYGVIFDGHPDLRRILMWDELTDFPMRKDYQAPDDYEWEPTPHDEVLEKVKARA
jgi:NADH-quinone oxidoreductase subunit C